MGFAQNRKSKKPDEKKRIAGGIFVMKKVSGVWKLNEFDIAKIDCSLVTVQGLSLS